MFGSRISEPFRFENFFELWAHIGPSSLPHRKLVKEEL
jgi:hypothetical protein